MGFLAEIVTHLRLTWRLLWDERVRWWQRMLFTVPIAYLLIPVRYDVMPDLAPVIGLLDDWMLLGLVTYLFVAICPRTVVREYRAALALSDPRPVVREWARADLTALKNLPATKQLEMYRHPREAPALALSLFIMLAVLTAGGALFGVLLFLLLSVSYLVGNVTQRHALRDAIGVDGEQFPKIQACVDHCQERLSRVPMDVLVVPSSEFKAYTLGLDQPYTIVLSSRLIQESEMDELAAVIGRELGHALFEHTFFSSLLGGMLARVGVANSLWWLIFARWRRFAEQTADRAALLACGELDPVVRAVMRTAGRHLTAVQGATGQAMDVKDVLRQVYDWEPGEPRGHRGPFIQAYPSIASRIRALVDFDAQLLTWNIEMWLTQDLEKGV